MKHFSRLLLAAGVAGLVGWMMGCGGDTDSNTAPEIFAPAETLFVSGGTMAFQITTTDADGDVVELTVTRTQDGRTSDSTKTPASTWSDPNYSWQTTAATTGIDTLTVTASDGTDETVKTIYVSCVSILSLIPAIAARADTNFVATDTVRYTVSATDPNSDPVTLTVSHRFTGAGTGPTLTQSGDVWNWEWATVYTDSGWDTVFVEAADGIYTAYDTIAVTCRSVDPGPKGIRLLEPNGANYFQVGDTMTIRWSVNFDSITDGVRFGISPNGNMTTLSGAKWPAVSGWGFFYVPGPDSTPITQGSSYYKGNIGTATWVIPEKILNSLPPPLYTPTEISLISMNAKVCVQEASAPIVSTNPNTRTYDESDAGFVIAAADTVPAPAP